MGCSVNLYGAKAGTAEGLKARALECGLTQVFNVGSPTELASVTWKRFLFFGEVLLNLHCGYSLSRDLIEAQIVTQA